MSEEIELKFIVHPDARAALAKRISAGEGEHAGPIPLTNIYYETPDNTLRRHGIGLRIRRYGDRYEMTAKTAGRVVGGLHQHPEYNVDLPSGELDLSLLPADIWPPGVTADSLLPRLAALFRTDYTREKWVVTYNQSRIEIAYDQGEVTAGELSEPIGELELELLEGNTADLLAFAQTLSTESGLRLGSLSKAARGYHLAKGNPRRDVRPLPLLKPAAKATVEQGMVAALTLALGHWQYHEELWLTGNAEARRSILEGITLIRETFVVMGNMVPRKATTGLRSQLTILAADIEEAGTDPAQLCYSAAWLQCKLALTSWLESGGWRGSIDEQARRKLAGSYKRFADQMLARCGAELKVAFGRTLSREEYAQQLPRLEKRLMAFHLLSGAYPAAAVVSYIAHWKGLQQAILQPETSDTELVRRQAVTQQGFWRHNKP
ncbi:CYTH and CHAD domain-containing protein [Biostraticola tofi]|uniref:Triphosphatase n=1 Tax=Biostraticola tofi TaxID=466109 RepID=A0A4R3YZV1_9GAMM|nr:inorganic triphosphatase [Biostraticola tofi]TCV98850.1 triphosphatase [Biostraticola tofi]